MARAANPAAVFEFPCYLREDIAAPHQASSANHDEENYSGNPEGGMNHRVLLLLFQSGDYGNRIGPLARKNQRRSAVGDSQAKSSEAGTATARRRRRIGSYVDAGRTRSIGVDAVRSGKRGMACDATAIVRLFAGKNGALPVCADDAAACKGKTAADAGHAKSISAADVGIGEACGVNDRGRDDRVGRR